MAYLMGAAFIIMSIAAMWYKARAERAEEWVWYIVSEVERLVEEDQQPEA